jgi:hypothetical protein
MMETYIALGRARSNISPKNKYNSVIYIYYVYIYMYYIHTFLVDVYISIFWMLLLYGSDSLVSVTRNHTLPYD